MKRSTRKEMKRAKLGRKLASAYTKQMLLESLDLAQTIAQIMENLTDPTPDGDPDGDKIPSDEEMDMFQIGAHAYLEGTPVSHLHPLEAELFLEDGILVTEFGGNLLFMIGKELSDKAFPYRITYVAPPLVAPVTASLASFEAVWKMLSATFNLEHFRYIPTDKISSDLVRMREEMSAEQLAQVERFVKRGSHHVINENEL